MKQNMFTRTVGGALMLTLSACTSFGPVPAREYLPIEHPTNIWITKSDNTVVRMQAPKLIGDTLVGYVNGDFQEVMLSQTKQIQAKRPQPGRTALAVGAGVVGVAAVAVLAAGKGSPCVKWDGTQGGWVPCVNQSAYASGR
jgi:hypothetical protein